MSESKDDSLVQRVAVAILNAQYPGGRGFVWEDIIEAWRPSLIRQANAEPR
jgi:hypothetical protein